MHDSSIPRGLCDSISAEIPMSERSPVSPDMRRALAVLLQRWDQQIKKRMENAQQEDSETGRHFIEYGAICIYNCAMELRGTLEGQPGQAPGDLGLEVIEQHAEGP